MYWYVLFVRTGHEERVEKFLKERLDTKLLMPFIPLQERLFKISGTVKREVGPLFPGYVFIESEMFGTEFVKKIHHLIYTSCDVIKLLRYSDTEISMRESEKRILLSLCNDQHCIEASSGIIEGNKVHIKGGPLKGRESIVKKVDRHKRRAEIELMWFGDLRRVSVALEIVSKVK